MNIIGYTILPLVFSVVDCVFRAHVRVVEVLPFDLILGAALMRHYSCVIDFDGADFFKPTKDSRAVPLLLPKPPPNLEQPWRERAQVLQSEKVDARWSVRGWRVAHSDVCSGRVCCEATESVTAPCLLYTSPSPRDATLSRMPSSA